MHRLLRLAPALLVAGCCLPPSSIPASRGQVARVEAKVEQVLANQAEMQQDLEALLEIAARQGTGEVTLFFPWARDVMPTYTRRYERLERWLDNLVLQSRGRPIQFVLVASAADWKNDKWNRTEAENRLHSVRKVISRQLLHVPHRYDRTIVMDPSARPVDSKARPWRHVRVIAYYRDDQRPALPPALP